MATQQSTAHTSTSINIPMLKLYVNLISIFNGNPNELNNFISSCEVTFKSIFGQINDADLQDVYCQSNTIKISS